MSDIPWWHQDLATLAASLSKGVLNEMKRRILTSNIQKEKLTLNESSDRMKSFFEREIIRYGNRKAAMKQKQQQLDTNKDQIDIYKEILRKLLQCNVELASKCQKNNIPIEKIIIHGKATCWH